MPESPLVHVLKIIGDYFFGGLTLAVVLSWLPHVTALLALSWWCVRWYETIQSWRKMRRDDRGDPDER